MIEVLDSPTLADLETLARRAGKLLRSGFGQRHAVEYKGSTDLVTEMDRRVEALVIGEIQARFPTHQVVAEESGTLEGDRERVWYVDPLDGTVNYVHGLPFFAVSVGYAQQGKLTFGVVYDPIREECFSAATGLGAWVNGERLRVSAEEDLGRCLLVTGFPNDVRTNPDNNLEHFVRFERCTQGVRRFGSAALSLCYVAAGRLDGFWEVRVYPWDIAAGSLILQEAQGVVSKFDGNPDMMASPHSILAANPYIHPQMLRVLHTGMYR